MYLELSENSTIPINRSSREIIGTSCLIESCRLTVPCESGFIFLGRGLNTFVQYTLTDFYIITFFSGRIIDKA